MKNPDHNSYRISVVIPTYNSAAYIGRAIRSVQGQSYPAHEIIVVDDGSTDDTGLVVSEFGSGVRYIRQSNTGAASARNNGIQAAEGEWIAFLDADDEWLPNKLQRQVELLKRHPELVWVYGNFYQCGCGGKTRQIAHSAEVLRTIAEETDYFANFFTAWLAGFYMWIGTVLVRRQAIIDAGLFQTGLYKVEDSDMWYRLSYRWSEVGYIRDPISIYHVCIPTCVTRTYNQTSHVCRLIDRNLKISAAHDRYKDFLPIASMALQLWMRNILAENRLAEIRYLLVRFGYLLPIRFRCETYVRIAFLDLGSGLVEMVHRIKNWLHNQKGT